MCPSIASIGKGRPFTLAHLSDPHLTSPAALGTSEMGGKRALGYLSWRLRRRHIHLPEVLARLVEDLHAQRPAHTAVTGDLTQLGTAAELAQARAWLERCGPPARVSAVPGNHDVFARGCEQDLRALWGPFMSGDDGAMAWPFLRRRGPAALIGLSSARPTAAFLASGRLGARQLTALEGMLAMTASEGYFRVVMLHHPPVAGLLARRKALDDAAHLAAVLSRRGAELVLHGHTHRSMQSQLPGPLGPIPVLGAASASARQARGDHRAAYYLCRIRRCAGGWDLEIQCRRLDTATSAPEAGVSRRLRLAAAASDPALPMQQQQRPQQEQAGGTKGRQDRRNARHQGKTTRELEDQENNETGHRP